MVTSGSLAIVVSDFGCVHCHIYEPLSIINDQWIIRRWIRRLELWGNQVPLLSVQAKAQLNRFAIVLYCGSALSFSDCEQGVTSRVLATVLSVDGTAEVRLKGHSEFTRVTPATLLGTGALIRTGTSGTVNVAFLPNALASLSENAELQIDELALTKDGNAMRNDIRARVVRVLLVNGTMLASFNGLPDCKSDLTIRTPHGDLSANSDCILLVNIDNGRTRVTCVHGTVNTRIGQTNSSIEAGYFQEFPSSDRSPHAAADDSEAQREVMSVIETENELQNLARRQRLLRPTFLDRWRTAISGAKEGPKPSQKNFKKKLKKACISNFRHSTSQTQPV
jgi:FecR protein